MSKTLLFFTLLYGIESYADLVAEGFAVIQRHDYTKARILWAKACDNGNADGCHNLGMMYGYGDGVHRDPVVARKFYLQACNMGNDQACVDYTR